MRITLFLVLIIVSFTTPFWIFAVLSFAYVLAWRGFELLVVAIVIDAYLGTASAFPYVYSVYTLLLVYGASLLKPYLRFYTEYL